jgi:hypothetical protein
MTKTTTTTTTTTKKKKKKKMSDVDCFALRVAAAALNGAAVHSRMRGL